MKKEVHRLPDEHLAEAKKMVQRHRKRKNCNKCYDRGYMGLTEDNMIIPCSYCVDQTTVFEEWKTYVKARPELDAVFGKALEEEEKEGAKDVAAAPTSPMPGGNKANPRSPRE